MRKNGCIELVLGVHPSMKSGSTEECVTKSFHIVFLTILILLGGCSGGGTQGGVGSVNGIQGFNGPASIAIWAADDSIKVLQATDPVTGNPVIPMPTGYSLPANFTQSNDVWNGTTQTVTVQGASRETVAFQVFVAAYNQNLSGMDVQVSSLSGNGGILPASSVTLFREWYVPVSYQSGPNFASLSNTGNYPDPLIPFQNPYGSGTVGTPFSVSSGQVQGIWMDVAIPTGTSAGTYSGTISIIEGATVIKTLNLDVIVWNGTLPTFDSSNIMLKTWIPLYSSRIVAGEGLPNGSAASITSGFISMIQKYQVLGHAYDFDTQGDQVVPPSLTYNTTNNTVTIPSWTSYDQLEGPALTGALFPDGNPMRVINAPIIEEWNASESYSNWSYTSGTAPPTGLMSMLTNYVSQISLHFQANGWIHAELLGYLWDEPGGKLSQSSVLYEDVADYAQAVDAADAANGWSLTNAPVRFFLTTGTECTPGAFPLETASQCTWHEGLSYPSVSGISADWVLDWAPSAAFYEPGPSGLSPDYTIDGVSASSGTSGIPSPIEKWVYQYHDPFIGGANLNNEAIGFRVWPWIAFKYGLDGIFYWAATYWGTPTTSSTPSNSAITPYLWVQNYGSPYTCGQNVCLDQPSDGVMFYPGAQLPLIGLPAIAGPVPSIRMAMWRRGYQDYMYMWQLVQAGQSAQAMTTVNGIVNRALNWAMIDPYYKISGYNSPGAWSHNPIDYDNARLSMAHLLGYR